MMRPCPKRRSRVATQIAALCMLAALAAGGPAQADQFKQAADGASIDCAVSARELTRFSLIGDQFASVSKISSGYPYNDFAVTNEPVRGDIYVSVPETYAASRISFFATTKKGFVYKFGCPVERIEASQVFIANPAIAKDEARRWEERTPASQSAVRLIQAMAGGASIDGYQVRQSASPPARAGDLEVRKIADYRGASLAGRVLRIANLGAKPIAIDTRDLAPPGALAVAIVEPRLEPGAATSAFLVGPNGENAHD
jgi:conjugal transfer pilus assembly protein TraK